MRSVISGYRTLPRRTLVGRGLLAWALLVLAGVLAAPQVVAAAPDAVRQRTADVVTADSLPTAQITGVVWSQVIVGDTVFAGGDFTSVRPAGAAPGFEESPRHNLMSFSLSTGVATSFAPEFDGPVKALAVSDDDSTLYVGGQFAHVDGQPRARFAAFSVATGALTPLAPTLNATVNAIVNVGRVVYLGGAFSQVNGVTRSRLAAVDAASGALTTWAPTADATVQALVATPDSTAVVAGGSFATLSGASAPGMGSLDARTGSSRPWAINQVVRTFGENAAVLTLKVDQDTVYGGGYTFGEGNFEGVFAANSATGDVRWLQDCHGDTYDVAPVGDQVYSVGHAHFCTNIGGFPDTTPRQRWYRALAVTKQATGLVRTNTQVGSAYEDFGGQPAPALFNWFPEVASGTYTGLSQGAWSVTGTERYLVLGGEFPRVNNVAQAGLARFAVPALAPNRQGPRVTGEAATPTVSETATSLALSWPVNVDRDDQVLRYQVLRDGAVIKTISATSHPWQRTTLAYIDRTGSPGVSYRYQIRVSDPDGNTVTSPGVTASYPSDDAYARRIRSDGAQHQWRLGGTPGQIGDPDQAGSLPLTVSAGVRVGDATGAVKADADSAATFDGTSAALARTAASSQRAGAVSIEAWVRTTDPGGGALVGFGAGAALTTVPGLRQLYLDSGGRVRFSVRGQGTSSPVTVTGPQPVTDGRWHSVVGVQAASQLQLFLDGQLVATRALSSPVPALTGRWVLGGSTPPALPARPAQAYGGALDEASVFPSALTAAQAYQHHRIGSGRLRVVDVDGRR